MLPGTWHDIQLYPETQPASLLPANLYMFDGNTWANRPSIPIRSPVVIQHSSKWCKRGPNLVVDSVPKTSCCNLTYWLGRSLLHFLPDSYSSVNSIPEANSAHFQVYSISPLFIYSPLCIPGLAVACYGFQHPKLPFPFKLLKLMMGLNDDPQKGEPCQTLNLC